MLLYNPAFDMHHCMFRYLSILSLSPENGLDPEKLRILDYYLLFPKEIGNIRVEPLFIKTKNRFKTYKQYERLTNPTKVFFQMEPLFDQSIKHLIAYNLIKHEDNRDLEAFILNFSAVPSRISEKIKVHWSQSAEIADFFVNQLINLPTHGKNGLKDRTSLLPSRNDRK